MKLFKQVSSLDKPIPLHRSGWFYLWLCLLLVVLWGNHRNYWSLLEIANLQFWRETTLLSHANPTESAQNSLRITDIRLDSHGLKQIKHLSDNYPDATFAIMGDYSQTFITKLNSPTYLPLSNNSVLLGKANTHSLAALSLNNENIPFYENALSLGGMIVARPFPIKWSTFEHVKVAFQPQQNSVSQAAIWRDHGDYYTSFVGYSVLQSLSEKSHQDKSWSIAFGKRVEILVGDSTLPIGINGNIVAKFSKIVNRGYSDILSTPITDFTGIFIIDDLSVKHSELIAQAITDLREQDYLYSNWLTRILEMLFLIITVMVIFRFSRASIVFDIILAASMLSLLLVIQYLFLSLSLWMPLSLILITATLSGVIQWAVQKERLFLLKNVTFKKATMAQVKNGSTNDSYDQTLVINTSDNSPQGSSTPNVFQLEYFGRYKVTGILGKGAMGIVFQGSDPKINRSVAIKTLQLNEQIDSDSLQETKDRFFREAETAGNLSHANIVTIYDVGEEQHPDSDQLLGYIAMDLLTGQPLSEYVDKKKLLPPALVYQLMIQMTDALEYAHNQNVIHRDIKPANIMYDDDLQRGTLTDFGIAHITDHSKTKTGTIIGSPYYMSPEQILGIKIDGRSDVFSLGVTFYQLLSGELPFTGESIATVAFHITKTKHKPVRQKNKKLRSSAARITNKALQKDKTKRYQSMQDFKQALVNALKKDYRKSPLQ